MAATPLTLPESPQTETVVVAAQRPTLLFENIADADYALDSSRQQQLTPSHVQSPTTSAAMATSPSGSCSSAATSPSFLPEMPQWKKDLIQRRKSNVARTIGAAAAMTPTSPNDDDDHQAADGFQSPTKDFTLKSTTVYQSHTITATTTKSAKTKVTSTHTTSQKHAATTAAAAELQKNAKSNLAKMPATTKTASSPTSTPTSPISTPTAEKAEKFIGGHYTPQAATKDENERMVGKEIGMEPHKTQQLPLATTTTPSSSPTKSTAPIPKQRSLFLASPSSTAAATATKSQTKEQQESDSFTSSTTTTTMKSGGAGTTNSTVSEKRLATQTTTATTTITRLTSSSTLREREHANTTADIAADEVVTEMHETETTRKSNTIINNGNGKSGTYAATTSTQRNAMQSTTSPLPIGANNSPQQLQSHSKYESERTSTSNNPTNAATLPLVDSAEKTATNPLLVCGKISNKLQNNQFIKNQQTAATTTSPKYLKYKSHSVQETPPTTTASTPTGCCSPTKTSANTATTCAIKKKMVAVQEMKKTTQNANHHHHHHQQQQIIGGTTCARQQQQQHSPTGEPNFDPSEDLSYGPGIVSKLRCRYLSLALRESMEKQRHCLDNLRRATSLNNLLDRDDDHHKDEHEDDEDGEDEVGVELRTEADKQSAHDLGESVGKYKSGGILKHNNEAQNQVGKKTATFQKFAANNNAGVHTNGTRMSQSQYGGSNTAQTGSANTATDTLRSRQVKRGNDSLKRARSVEALLCEKSPWNFALNRTTFDVSSKSPPTATTPTCVTIEDKIHNARHRLAMGTDTMPPKRLTSIIDDTERPPPDLVKQTLKLFEATANRRGRGPSRTNGKGDVANKVATYKSIIKENKPAIVFPKPPSSPTKKMPIAIASPKPLGVASDLISSPIGRKTSAVAAGSGASTPTLPDNMQLSASTPKYKIGSSSSEHTPLRTHTSNAAVAGGSGVLSDNSPDIIPRHKLLAEKSEQAATAVVDSPFTALTKKLEKLSIDADKQQQQQAKQSANVNNVTTKESQAKQQQHQQSKQLAAEPSSNGNEANNDYDDAYKFVGGDASVADDKNDRASTAAAVELDTAQAGTAPTSSDLSDDEYGLTKRVTKSALDNIAKAGTTQQFKFAGQTTKSNITNGSQTANTNTNSASVNDLLPHPSHEIPTSVLNAAPGKQIGVIRPLLNTPAPTTSTTPTTNTNHFNNQQHMETLKQQSTYSHSLHSSNTSSTTPSPLTSREIEKNRINEMKKTALADTSNAVNATAAAAAASSACATSLDTVINTNAGKASSSSSSSAAGFSELDAVTSSNSPLWALRKKRQPPAAVAENTTMVFNFSNRKEVPDYIENDGVVFRRKRELPKPNDSGFVLLGDLSLETSTDDDYFMCPPSPCDVEFQNANIVIGGKSSMRQSKEATNRVQFNDTLTSTFEYPSEASLIVDDSFNDHYADDLLNAFEHLVLKDTDSPAHHHHVAVDEIIQLPTQHASTPANASTTTGATTNTPTKNILGNLPLGSAPLGFYTPVKAPINDLFQLGVTRAPNGHGHAYNTTNGNGTHNGVSGLGSVVGIRDGLIGDNDDEPESLQYLKPANDDLTIAYSEGAQKNDLLY